MKSNFPQSFETADPAEVAAAGKAFYTSVLPLAYSADRARELAEQVARRASAIQNAHETRRLMRLARRMEVAALIREWSGQNDRSARMYRKARALYCTVAVAHMA